MVVKQISRELVLNNRTARVIGGVIIIATGQARVEIPQQDDVQCEADETKREDCRQLPNGSMIRRCTHGSSSSVFCRKLPAFDGYQAARARGGGCFLRRPLKKYSRSWNSWCHSSSERK